MKENDSSIGEVVDRLRYKLFELHATALLRALDKDNEIALRNKIENLIESIDYIESKRTKKGEHK